MARAGKMADKAMDAGRAFEKTGDFYTVKGTKGLDELLGALKTGEVARVRSTEDIMVFRTYAGHEGHYMDVARLIHGGSWSTIDPRTVLKSRYISMHGIPVVENAPDFIAIGKISAGTEFYFRQAKAYGSYPGGGPDILNRIRSATGPIDVNSVDILEWAIPY